MTRPARTSAPATRTTPAWRAHCCSISRPRGAQHWVRALPERLKPLRGTIASSLVASGVLDERRGKLLGLFPTTRFPELEPGPERELRARLHAVLVDGVAPDAHTASLLSLLVSMDLVKHLVPRPERKAAVARAKACGDRGAVGDAVKAAAAQQVSAAVAAGAVAAAAAATAAGS